MGESPPHGGTFFYKGDSRLYRNMKAVLRSRVADFLAVFKAKGFFLDDLVLYPINQIKDKDERDAHRRSGVSSLAGRMAGYRPLAVVAVMCAIKPMVAAAMHARLACPTYPLVRDAVPWSSGTSGAFQGENGRNNSETASR